MDPTKRCNVEYENSRKITGNMVTSVKNQNKIFDPEIEKNSNKIKNEIKKSKAILDQVKKEIGHDKIKTRTLEASTEIGASNWLKTLPLKEKGFLLDKQSFWDSLFLRDSIPLPRLPSKCVCGKPFTVDHALSCCRGGFISTRHNELRDFTAELVSE